MRIAILDNYNDLAQTAADWSPLAGCELVFFNTHEADEIGRASCRETV